MAYKFVFSSEAEKQLRTLDTIVARRILKKLQWLSKLSDPLRQATRLHNAKIGDARYRIGDYRVIVIVDYKSKRIVIAALGHRRDIYR